MSRVITEEGGELHLERYAVKVTIPPKAVEWPVEVSIKLLTDTSKLDIREGEIVTTFGVQCSPDGQTFKKPVCVILPHSAVFTRPSNVQAVLHYVSENKHDQIEDVTTRIPLSTASEGVLFCKVTRHELQIHIDHFSGIWASLWSVIFGSSKTIMCWPFSNVCGIGETQYLRLRIFDKTQAPGLKEDIEQSEERMGYKPRHCGRSVMVKRGSGSVHVSCEIPDDQPPVKLKEMVSEQDVFGINDIPLDFRWVRGTSNDVLMTVSGMAEMKFPIPMKTNLSPSGQHETSGDTVTAERNRLDEGICKLAKQFPPGKFPDLCCHLDVKIGHDTQSHILIRHNQDYEGAVRHVLHIWKNKTEGANVEGLKGILIDIELGGLIDILRN